MRVNTKGGTEYTDYDFQRMNTSDLQKVVSNGSQNEIRGARQELNHRLEIRDKTGKMPQPLPKSNSNMHTKADPSMNPTEAPPTDLDEQMEGDEPLEPFGAQVLRRIHENHVVLMEEYDEAIELLDHPEVKKHLTKLLQGIEATLTATEGLLGKHYPDLPGIEGAENKGLDEESEIEEEEEAPADEAAEAMLEKGLRGRAKQMFRQYKSWAKAMGVCPGCGKEDCGCTEEPPQKAAPKFSTKRLVKTIGKVLGKDLTEDEVGEVVDKLETEASDTEPDTKALTQRICKALGKDMSDDETTEMMGQVDEQMEQKSILCKSHKDAVRGAAGFLEEAGQHSGNWEDEHRMKAMSWHKALSEVGADPEPDMVEGADMVDEGMPGEMGQKAGFELVYGNGGHGGPYSSLEEARNRAQQLLQGSRTERSIYIVPRDERTLDRRNAVEEVRKDEKGLRFVKAMAGVQVNNAVSVSGNQGIVTAVDKTNQTADVKFNNGHTVVDISFDDLTWEGGKSITPQATKALASTFTQQSKQLEDLNKQLAKLSKVL